MLAIKVMLTIVAVSVIAVMAVMVVIASYLAFQAKFEQRVIVEIKIQLYLSTGSHFRLKSN